MEPPAQIEANSTAPSNAHRGILWSVVVALWAVLMAEILLTIALRRLGWNRTWIVTGWCAIGLISLALLGGGLVGVRWWAQNRFRYRIGTLLVGFTLLSVGLAAISAVFIRPYVERRGARKLQQLGCEMHTVEEVEYSRVHHTYPGRSNPGLLPLDRNIANLMLSDDRAIAEGGWVLESLPQLQYIHFRGSVTDRGLAALSKLRFQRTVGLSLSSPQVGDQAIGALRDCKQITALFLYGDQISERTIVAVSEFDHVTDLGLIGAFPGPSRGQQRHLSAAGREAVASMLQLEKLTIQSFDINDDEAATFSRLTNLRELRLWNTQMTERGKAELQKSLPNCVLE